MWLFITFGKDLRANLNLIDTTNMLFGIWNVEVVREVQCRSLMLVYQTFACTAFIESESEEALQDFFKVS